MACALLTAMLAGPLSFNRAQDVGRDEAVVSALARIDSQQIRANLTRLVGFGTRHALSDPKPDDRGARAASDWIHAMFRRAAASSSGRMTVSFDAFDPRDYARGGEQRALANLGVTEIRNVIAKLEGTEPDRVIIVSGHYDSRVSQRYDAGSDAPGANDDGSGTVAVLELARALADVPTRASIWFVAMTAEELGLWGSQNLAKFCDENDVAVEAMITNDIIGGAKDDAGQVEDRVVRIFSEGRPQVSRDSHPRRRRWGQNPSESDSPSREFARHVARTMEAYLPEMTPRLIFRQDRFLRGGDHRPFNERGFAAIRFTEPKENYRWQHEDLREADGLTYGDRLENVDFDYVARVTKVNAASILTLARAPRAPDDVAISSRLSNATGLSWKESDDKTIVNYRLLLRRTHEPRWTLHRDLGRVFAIEVPESKDDWLFAVQAVDAQGRASLASFALPGRR